MERRDGEGEGRRVGPSRSRTHIEGARVRCGLRARLFAGSMARAGATQARLYGERTRRLVGAVSLPPGAVVVEIGAGAGPNAAVLPPGTRWVAVEPNVHFAPHLCRAAEAYGLDLEIVAGTAERLALPTASADAVLSTLVLCSVADPAAVLAEVRRVLKPGAPFLFVEHVAAPRGTALRALQRGLRAPWAAVADGCRLDRETEATIRAAGFETVEVERFRLALGLVAPHAAGTARC